MRWKKIGDTFYGYGHGLKITLYEVQDGVCILRVYTEPGGKLILDQTHANMAAAKRWAATYMKGTK